MARMIDKLILEAERSGFEMYCSLNEGALQHEILTCMKGKYSGEVIDIYYSYGTDIIDKIEYSSQFPTHTPKFAFKG